MWRDEKMASIEIKVPDWLDGIFAWPATVYRRHKYGYPFRRIYLGEGLFTIVDPTDYYHLNNFHWSGRRNRECIYAIRFINDLSKKAKIVSMHKEIMNPRKGLIVDHRNCDGLDNRRANLRPATPSQNMYNRRKKKNTTSKFIGVSFHNKVR
jgi:hypothetical protein